LCAFTTSRGHDGGACQSPIISLLSIPTEGLDTTGRMQKLKTLLILIVIIGALAALYSIVSHRPSVIQPIAFNHSIHTGDVGIDCIDCHQYFKEHAAAGLPGEEVCGGCHEEPITDSPEEKKLITSLASGKGITFKKLFNLADHVYFSHRRHVTIAGLECEKCHGSIAEATSPPPRPLVKVDMNFCLDCHKRMGVTTDCVACHR